MPFDPNDFSITTAAVLLGRMSGFVEIMAIVPTGDTDMDLCRASFLADWKEDVEVWMRAWAERGDKGAGGGGESSLPKKSWENFFDLTGE